MRAGIKDALGTWIVVGTAAWLNGCNQPPAVNPWRDDSIPQSAWTTPSEQQILAANHAPSIRQRDGEPALAPLADERVPHYPLWWEDPFEDKGDRDGQFAWTWQDYFGMPYSFGRFLLNTMAWPVSAVVTPPGTPMVSDGVIGRDHDAERGFSPNPSATHADFWPEAAVCVEHVHEDRVEYSVPTASAPAS